MLRKGWTTKSGEICQGTNLNLTTYTDVVAAVGYAPVDKLCIKCDDKSTDPNCKSGDGVSLAGKEVDVVRPYSDAVCLTRSNQPPQRTTRERD